MTVDAEGEAGWLNGFRKLSESTTGQDFLVDSGATIGIIIVVMQRAVRSRDSGREQSQPSREVEKAP